MDAKRLVKLLICFGSGATVMYYLDGPSGGRRRSVLRDQVRHGVKVALKFMYAGGRDLAHRAKGMRSILKSSLRNMESAQQDDDAVVLARVRSKLGRVVAHPHSIESAVTRGHVTLSGSLSTHELKRLIICVLKVPGVRSAESRLLSRKRRAKTPHPRSSHWSPAERLLVIAGCTGSLVLGARRRDALGVSLAGISAGLIARAATNIDARRLFGVGGGHRAVTVSKSINIKAPIFRVYQLMTDLANFSHFMTDVVEVRATGHNRFHWVVRGLAGFPVSWDAVILRHVPNEVLAWRSEPGALVKHAGQIRFRANSDGSTQIEIELSYNPPGGALGHGLAKLLGDDPKSKMNEDLMRLKSLIETGPSARQVARGVSVH